jgi:hypothetical protein
MPWWWGVTPNWYHPPAASDLLWDKAQSADRRIVATDLIRRSADRTGASRLFDPRLGASEIRSRIAG